MKIEENKQNALSEELKLSSFINKERVYIGITRWSYSQLLIIKKDNEKSNKMIMGEHYFGGTALFWWNPPWFTTLPLEFTNYLLDVLPLMTLDTASLKTFASKNPVEKPGQKEKRVWYICVQYYYDSSLVRSRSFCWVLFLKATCINLSVC